MTLKATEPAQPATLNPATAALMGEARHQTDLLRSILYQLEGQEQNVATIIDIPFVTTMRLHVKTWLLTVSAAGLYELFAGARRIWAERVDANMNTVARDLEVTIEEGINVEIRVGGVLAATIDQSALIATPERGREKQGNANLPRSY